MRGKIEADREKKIEGEGKRDIDAEININREGIGEKVGAGH